MKKSIKVLGATLLVLACLAGIAYLVIKYPLWYFGTIALFMVPCMFEKPMELHPDDPSF